MSDYNFLGLVNDVCGRLNEIQLTSANFANANGFYKTAKEAVNSSIRAVNYQQYEWPFNHVTQEETLTPGTVRYTYPSDVKLINMDSFRIKRDNSLNIDTTKLIVMDYEEYLTKYSDAEYNTSDTGIRAVPRVVFRAPSLEIGVYPAPDKAYTLVYEYYRLPVDLELYSDVPSVPEQFRHVIVDGAMYHAYMFRSNNEAASIAKSQFDAGVKQMRSIYINRTEYMYSTYIVRNTNRATLKTF